MPSILLISFLLQLVIHLVNTVGAVAINDLLWMLYNKFPTPTSSSVQQQRELRREIVRLKQELKATSAQDQFAKWAKLQRQHDKVVQEHDAKAQSMQSFRSSFDRVAWALRWLSTNGMVWFLQWWYGKQPMFWLEKAWVPYYIEWILSFPRAPLGSVSIQIWTIACASVVRLLSQACVSCYGLYLEGKAGTKEKVKVPAGAGKGEKGETKKEL